MLKPCKINSILCLVFFLSCGKGWQTTKEPIHVNPNMDYQEKYEYQEESKFFSDTRVVRERISGTISRDVYQNKIEKEPMNEQIVTGMLNKNDFLNEIPKLKNLKFTGDEKDFIFRGKDRFNIYCSACHGKLADGKGIISFKGFKNIPSLHSDRMKKMLVGQIYSIIKNGQGRMKSYGPQISVKDRWAITRYLKFLQKIYQKK